MTPEDEKEIAALMRAALEKDRGYASFFGWPIDRDLEEWAVANILHEALLAKSASFFCGLKGRGRGNDPPDCEAADPNGRRVAIEVTELVSGKAIQAYKRGETYEWADWSQEEFLSALSGLLVEKALRRVKLKEGPYDGGYVVIVYTDEPMLQVEKVRALLQGSALSKPEGIDRAFLLLSYDPRTREYPYVELPMTQHGASSNAATDIRRL
jgi:hypothetical protein